MIWCICFALAVVLLGMSMAVFFVKKRGSMRPLWALIIAFLGAYTLYIPLFFQEYNFPAALFGTLFNVFQMITLETDYLACSGLLNRQVTDAVAVGGYQIILAVFHFLLPVLSAMTAVTIIMRCLTQMRVRLLRKNRKNLYVFSQVNYKARTLAEDIRRHDPKGNILFMEVDREADHAELRESLGCMVLDEKIESIRARAKDRVVHYYCINEDQDENLNSALAILRNLQNEKDTVQKNNYIFLFSEDPLVEPLIDSLDKGLVEIDVINEYQNAAYRLLDEHSLLDGGREGRIDVLMCGFTKMSRECMRAMCWCGQLKDFRLTVRVVGDIDEDARLDFMSRYPGLFTDRYDIRFYNCQNQFQLEEALTEHCDEADYIVVAEETEAKTIENAVFLRRHFYRTDPAFANAPQIYAYIPNADKAKAVASMCTAELNPKRRVEYGIVPFGVATDVYTFANITDSALEKLAKNVHLVYEDIFSEGEIDALAAIKNYNRFEVNKRSNRANALHIRYKLQSVGLDYTDDPDAQEVDLAAYLDEETLAALAYYEHDRWMAFLDTEGWSTASLEQVDAYKASGISGGRHNCPLLKMHPYICPFDELKARADHLGLEDSTIYDVEFVARIPQILHDRWGITGKKYKIIKR